MRLMTQLRHVVLAVTCSFICLVFSSMAFAQAKQFDKIVAFGTSLSDSGNAFILLSDPYAYGIDENCSMGTPVNVPPYDQLDDLLIPDGSYAKGGHHVTNGATWIEQLAKSLGLAGNARPALRNPGKKSSNYAVGGSRILDFPCRFNLADQLEIFSEDFPGQVSANTLFTIEMGVNDIRDILVSYNPDDPTDSFVKLYTALGTIEGTVRTLQEKGARNFLLVNIPPIGETPAVSKLELIYPGSAYLANYLAIFYNSGMDAMMARLNGELEGVDIRLLDIYALVYDIIDTPEAFGILNTEDACVTPNVPPFTCKEPATYLFWDGIHPTKAVHEIVAEVALDTLNE